MLVLRPHIIAAYTPDAQVIAAAMPLVLIIVFYHLFDALQITTAFVLRAYKVTLVPTVIYAVALWGIGLGGGYLLGFDVGGAVPLGCRARAASGSRIRRAWRGGRRPVALLAGDQRA